MSVPVARFGIPVTSGGSEVSGGDVWSALDVKIDGLERFFGPPVAGRETEKR